MAYDKESFIAGLIIGMTTAGRRYSIPAVMNENGTGAIDYTWTNDTRLFAIRQTSQTGSDSYSYEPATGTLTVRTT